MRRALALIGAAALGLLGAHELDYRFVVPDPEHRHDLLLRTGHGYLSRALFIVLVVGIMSLVASVALGVARARNGGSPAFRLRSVGTLLAIVQSGGFIMLEAVERLIVGTPPDDRLLLVTLSGVGVQILTAFLAAFFLVLLERGAEKIARAWGRPPMPSAAVAPVVRRARALRPRDGSTSNAIRGPPLPAVA